MTVLDILSAVIFMGIKGAVKPTSGKYALLSVCIVFLCALLGVDSLFCYALPI